MQKKEFATSTGNQSRDFLYIDDGIEAIVKSIKLKTAEYPGFPTDAQGQLMVLLCMANGQSEIIEEIFDY